MDAKPHSWNWSDESFVLDADSPLAISQSLWEEWAHSEADAKSLFASTPSSEISDPRSSSSAMPATATGSSTAEEAKMSQGVSAADADPEEEDSPKFKRRRMLLFPGEQGQPLEQSQEIVASPGRKDLGILGCNEDMENSASKDASFTFNSYEEISGDAIEAPESWMLECFIEDQELHYIPPEQLNSILAESPFPEKENLKANTSEASTETQSASAVVGSIQGRFKLAAPVAYPFAVVKPSGVEGDTTLNDINQRILMPPSRPIQHPVGDHQTKPPPLTSSASASSSGISGKAVVACTKIHTEGKGTITIMRTRG